MQTASLYYQAINGAAGSGLPGAKAGDDDIVGSSPWMPVVVDIVDNTLNRVTATAVVSVQFVATAVPNHVLFALDGSAVHDTVDYKNTHKDPFAPAAHVEASHSDSNLGLTRSKSSNKDMLVPTSVSGKDAAKVELLLKQAFISADADKSGTVSSAELLSAIRASQTMSEEGGDEQMGLFREMMVTLAGSAAGSLAGKSMKELEQTVSKLFLRLDVDGDGSISWWEWRRVLMASMLSIQRFGPFISLRDSLLLTVVAANDAIVAASSSSLSSTSYEQDDMSGEVSSTAAFVNIPFIKPNQAFGGPVQALKGRRPGQPNPNAQQAGVDERDPLDDLPADMTPAKAVPRLQNMVKTLRYTNQSLTRRLENAIVQSHKILSREKDPKAFVDEFRDQNNTPEGEIQLEVFRATKRAQDAELQQAIMTKALQFEKQRAMKLELELAQTKRLANDLQNSMAQKDNINRGSRDKLQDEIRKHSEKLEQLKDLKEQEDACNNAVESMDYTLRLTQGQNNIHTRNKDRLAHHLSGMVARKKYLKDKEERSRSAASIQASLRGRRERALLKKKHDLSTSIQSVWRGKRARQLRQTMLIERAAAAFSKEYSAASVISVQPLAGCSKCGKNAMPLLGRCRPQLVCTDYDRRLVSIADVSGEIVSTCKESACGMLL